MQLRIAHRQHAIVVHRVRRSRLLLRCSRGSPSIFSSRDAAASLLRACLRFARQVQPYVHAANQVRESAWFRSRYARGAAVQVERYSNVASRLSASRGRMCSAVCGITVDNCWRRCVGSIASAVRWTKDVPWCRAALAEAVGKAAACFSVGMKPKQSTSSTENLKTELSLVARVLAASPIQSSAATAPRTRFRSCSSSPALLGLDHCCYCTHSHSLLFHYTPLPIYRTLLLSNPHHHHHRKPFPLPPLSPSPGPVPSALRNRLLRCFVCDPPPPPGHDGLFIPALQA